MKLSPRRKEQIVTHATTFPRLFSSFPVRAFVLKNRIVSTSHDAHFGVNGLPTDRYIRYHVEKAKGARQWCRPSGLRASIQPLPGAPATSTTGTTASFRLFGPSRSRSTPTALSLPANSFTGGAAPPAR